MKKHILSFLTLLLFSIGIYAQTAPQVDFPIDDVIVEQGFVSTTVDLTSVFSDPNDDPLTLTATSDDTDVVTVAILGLTLTITEVGNGSCNVTVNASDGGEDVDDIFQVTVTDVNDAPVVSDIPDQTIAEGATFTSITLDDYVIDLETADADIVWTYLGNTELTVSIVSRVATITIPDVNWNGGETITFTASDNDGTPLSDSDAATFTVTGVNDAPVVSDIPDQTIAEGATFTSITLDDYVTDLETADADIVWTYLGNTELTVSIASRVATITIPDVNWNGGETITFTASDNDGTPLSDSDAATFTVSGVNDAPVVSDIPDQTIAEGATFTTITLDNFVTDAETTDAAIAWTYSGNTELTVSIVSRVATITIPDVNWNGNETITFTGTDNDGTNPLSDFDVATFTVTGVNDGPVVSDIPNQTIAEGSTFTTITLDNYVTDLETADADIVWTYSGNSELTVSIVSNIATITIPDVNWNGGETITFTATDNDGTNPLSDFDAATFTVTGVNDAPVVSDIPDQTIAEGSIFTTITLDNFVTDAETADAAIAWTYSGNTELTVSIVSRVATITIPDVNWNGSETITFTASDNDGTPLSDSDAATFTVTEVNDAPTFTSVPVTSATEDLAYSYTATAVDIDRDYISFRAPALPLWLTFDTTTHILSGTPGDADVGIHNITLRISDGLISEDQVFDITVANVNDAPTFTSLPLITATQDAPYLYTVTADDLDEDSLIFRATVLPIWLNFNDTTHILSGIPGNEHVGIHNVTLTVTDRTVIVEQVFAITVGNENDAPTFSSTPDTTATQGILYSYAVTASDLDADTLSFTVPTLPIWLSFNDTTNILSGIPGDEHVGDHPVAIRVNDGAVDVDQSFIIEVENTNDAPTFLTIPDTVALQGTLYSFAVTAEDIDEDTLAFSAPLHPAWLSFNDTTNILSGIPGDEDVGDDTVTLRVNDGTVDVDTTFIIAVGNINDAPTFLFVPDTLALQEELYEATITAEDSDGDTLTFTAPTIPAWLIFNDTTNILSGIPGNDDVGAHNVTLRINDGTVDVDTSFVITVENVNDPPVFISLPDTVTMEDQLYTYTVAAMDVDGDTISYSAPVLPLWLSFDSVTHILSGTPVNADVGNHSVSLLINDSTDNTVQSFVIEVLNANDPPTITSTPITEARPGTAYIYTVTAMDIDGDALSYTALVLPGWLTFNSSNRTLSATPGESDIGDQHVTIRVSDGSLFTDHTFIISVSLANHAPTFISDPSTSIIIGESYVYTITAQDIDGDALIYSAPVLPDWLTFYPTSHVVSGVPQSGDIGRHNVTVRVSDGTVSADQSFPIYVEDENSEPAFTSAPVIAAMSGELYVYYATAEDGDEDDLIFNAPVLPDWLSFDANTQVLHGTPDNDDVGDHNVTLMVYDGVDTETQSFIITVDFQSGIGIDDALSSDYMLVYPNPSDGRFFVELSYEVERELILEILDPLGKILLKEEFPPYTLIKEEYNLSDRPAGIYFIRIYHKSAQTLKKLMIY